MLIVDAMQPFHPGEQVQVSATTGTLSLVDGTGPVHSTIWGFRAEVKGGSGIFVDSGQVLAGGAWVALGDIDSDGDLDAIAVDGLFSDCGSRVWINDGAGGYAEAASSCFTIGTSSSSISLLTT